MSNKGLSRQGLERLHGVLARRVESAEVPGVVALVSRGDETHVEVVGHMFVGRTLPMQRDTIFRIASLTKPVTAVAAMMLIEDCRMRLDDPVEQWLPELSQRRVLRSIASPLDDTVPARRAITVRDVLTYRMGFGSIMAMPGTGPIQTAIRDLRVGGDGPMLSPHDFGPDEWLRRLGSLPWLAHPGERWMYHVSGDVLGVLIARVSGQRLSDFLHERLFGPLGMKDTAFAVPPEKLTRLPGFYSFDAQQQALTPFDDLNLSAWASPTSFESGAGGLVSTIDDYFAFSRMLLDRGRHGTHQFLSPATIELMTSDQLLPEHRVDTEVFFGTHSSWGLGLAVNIRRDEIYRTPGRFGWDGGFGTSAYVDPTHHMIGILFTQRMMDSPQPPPVFTDFWTSAYAAMT